MASGWDMKLSRGASSRHALLCAAECNPNALHATDAAFAPAQPLSDKALELERRARALKEVENEELRKAAELNVLSPARLQHAPTAGAASERGNDPPQR